MSRGCSLGILRKGWSVSVNSLPALSKLSEPTWLTRKLCQTCAESLVAVKALPTTQSNLSSPSQCKPAAAIPAFHIAAHENPKQTTQVCPLLLNINPGSIKDDCEGSSNPQWKLRRWLVVISFSNLRIHHSNLNASIGPILVALDAHQATGLVPVANLEPIVSAALCVLMFWPGAATPSQKVGTLQTFSSVTEDWGASKYQGHQWRC